MSGREIVTEMDGMSLDQSTQLARQNDAPLVGPADSDVLSLMKLALQNKSDVDVLERLVTLKERVDKNNARAAFIAALSAFCAECPPIVKTRENSQFDVTRNGVKRKAKYAPLEDIDRIARPIAAKHGLVWTWDTTVDDKLMYVTCRVLHALGHSETATVSMPYASNAGSSPQQKYGSTQTYGMRYSLVAALGITTADEDTDGSSSGDGESITEQQAADLDALIQEVGVNRARFLDFMECSSVADISVRDYPRAVRFLERKRA